MPSSHRIASRDGLPFDFADGLKVAGITLSSDTGGQAIKIRVKDTDLTATDLYTWVRATAASLTTLMTTGVTVTTAVNQAAGTNSTLIANTAFVTAAVTAAINALVGSAPVAVNTIQELAAAINNDPAFSTTINAAVNLRSTIADVQKAAFTTASASLASTVDALSASFTPTVTSLIQGQEFIVRTKGTNTLTVPTFTPNQGVIAAKSIIKGAGVALAAGDIGIWACLQYDVVTDTFILLNPNTPATIASASTTVAGKVQLATNAVAIAGTDSTMAVTPSAMAAAISAAVSVVSSASRAPVISLGAPYNERGATLALNLSATASAPDTSIATFEIVIDGKGAVTAAAAGNAATYVVPSIISSTMAYNTSYQVVVTAIGNTGTRSPAAIRAITVAGVTKPTITFPAVNAINISLTPTLTSSAFTTSAGSDTHATSTWEIRTLDDVLVWTSVSALNKTSVVIPVNILQSGTNYKTRVMHVGNTYTVGSDWSDFSTFSTAVGTAITTQGIITALVPDSNARFGTAISMSDNGYCALGYENSMSTGRVDIHYHSTPLSSWGAGNDLGGPWWQGHHGQAVLVSPDGSRLAATAPFINNGAGGTTIYTLNNTVNQSGGTPNGVVEATILGVDNVNGVNGVGMDLACDATMSRLAISYKNQQLTGGLAYGIVSIYTRSGSTYTKEVDLAPNDVLNGYFGTSIAMDSGGVWLAVTTVTPLAKLIFYKRTGTTWSYVAEFTPDANNNPLYPLKVAFNAAGTRLVLGSSSGVSLNGCLHIYDFDGTNWNETAKLIDHSATAATACLGAAVDISASGDLILAGAPNADTGGFTNVGKTIIYRNLSGTWVQSPTDIFCPVQGNDVFFGYALSMASDGTKALIGAPNAHFVSGQQDSVYYYAF